MKGTCLYFIDILQGGCFDKSLKTERTVSLFDPVLDIFWPKPKDVMCIISKKDQTALNLDCSELHVAPKRKRILIIGASGQGTNLNFKVKVKYIKQVNSNILHILTSFLSKLNQTREQF